MYKSRCFTYLLVVVMALSLTSCINIIEKITFNKKGGGTYSITIDMGEMVKMIQMMGGGDSDDDSLLDSLNSGFDEFKNRFEAIEGISNARLEVDKETYEITTLYDFENLEALNSALSQYYQVDDQPVEDKVFFTRNKKQLVRIDESAFTAAMQEQLKGQGMDIDLSAILGDMYYESILTFQNKIKKVSDSDYQKLDSKTISLKYYPFKEDDADKSLAVKVRLK